MIQLGVVWFLVLAYGWWGYPAHAAAASKKIVVAHAAMNARVGPLWIARDRGFFAKYGVEADTIFVRGAPTLVAAMNSGDIDIGFTGGTAVVGAAASGSDLKILCSFTNRVTYDLVVRPTIKLPQDLKGKRFGVQSIGGTVWMGGILALEHLGLDPDRDKVSILVIGDQTVLAQALVAGTIDATVLDGVMSRRLHANGFPFLGDINKANLPILSFSIVARAPYIQKNPQVIEGVMKALLEGTAFALSPEQKPATLKILQKYLKIDMRDAGEGYHDMVAGFDRKPYARAEGVRNIIRLMKTRNPAVEKVTPDGIIDDRFLRKIDESGFIDQMYARYGVK
jgi:NitT/TauT family transport system substrate-binding protein